MRILCADDNLEFLETLKVVFTIHGCEVETASNGVEGLALFKANQGNFDVVITDMEMPQLDGVGFITALRKNGYQGRIVIMSGNLGKCPLEKCCEQKVDGYFQKPFALSSLIELLKLPTPKPGNLQPYQ